MQLGVWRFETAKPKSPQGGRPEKYYFLNFDQIAYVLTLTRSNEKTKEFRLRLILAFRDARARLRPGYSPCGSWAFRASSAAPQPLAEHRGGYRRPAHARPRSGAGSTNTRGQRRARALPHPRPALGEGVAI